MNEAGEIIFGRRTLLRGAGAALLSTLGARQVAAQTEVVQTAANTSGVQHILRSQGAFEESLKKILYRDPISVEGYGAAEGDADNTLAIERTLAAAASQGRPILLERNYKTRTIQIPSGTVIRGLKGAGALDIVDDGTASGRSILLDKVESVLIEGISIKSSNATGRTGVYGNLMMLGVERVLIRDCDFGKSPSTGVWSGHGSKLIQVSGCKVHDTFADGLHFTRGTEDVLAFGNEIWHCGDDGIGFIGYLQGLNADCGPMRNCHAINNIVRDSVGAGSGVVFLGVVGGSAVSNRITNTFLNGLTVSAVGSGADQTHYCRDVTLANNYIRNVSSGGEGFGVSVQNARGVTLRQNSVRGMASHALNVSGVVVDLSVEGGEYVSTAGRGFNHDQMPSTDARLRQELFSDAGETAPPEALSRNIRLRGRFESSTLDGLGISGASGKLIRGVEITGDIGVASGTAAHGLNASYCDRLKIVRAACFTVGTAEISTGFGVSLVACASPRVIHSEVNGVANTGLGLTSGCTQTLVAGNCFANNAAFGIFDDGTTTGLITNNFLMGNGTASHQGLAAATLADNIV